MSSTIICFVFFFFKQKTAYEITYGDWSSDVCSSDLGFSEQHVDKIARFDSQTGTFTEFPLPNAESDHRRIDIDPNHPSRIWWTGNTSGRIGFIELLDKN